MKSTKHFLAGVMFLILCTMSVTAQTNLIQNGGFENWTGGLPDNWTCASSSTTYSSTTTAKEGIYAMQIVTTNTNARNFSQALPTGFTAGETYTVSFWYMCTAFPSTSPTLVVKIQWDGNETVFTPNQTISLTELNTWKQVTVSGVVPEGATSANLIFSITKKPTIIFDGITVTKETADEPALDVAPGSLDYTSAGGYLPLQVTANRAWTASVTSTNTSWLYLAAGTSGQGNGSITPWTSENNTGAVRTGEVTITLEGGAMSKKITVNQAAKQTQTISGLSNLDKTVGDADFDLSATASSSLAVTYASSNENVATVSGSTVHIVGAGSTTITASQAGNGSYAAATPVTAMLTVTKASQTISGLSNLEKTVGDADFTLSATASSSLAVTYNSSNENVATINGSTVHIVGAGTTTITASQAGNDNYTAATPATVTLTVTKASQTISGLSNLDKTVGDADFDLSATASSSLAVTYSSSNENVATITGNTVHIVGAGTTTITASQAGNDNYTAATPVTATLTVTKASQTISGLSNMDKIVGDADFDLSATASSNLSVSYSSSNEQVATISGNTVHIVGAGTTTITASQVGNDNYSAATPITATLTVTPITGVGELHATLPVRIQNNNLIVSVQAGSVINIYNVLGVCLQSKTAENAETVISNLPQGQVLIVRCGKAIAKVIL